MENTMQSIFFKKQDVIKMKTNNEILLAHISQ